MKGSGSCTLVASMLASAASTVALSSSSASGDRPVSFSDEERQNTGREKTASSSENEKFAPRFDGLRFIETLVTAHR